jgi:SAM-dependent methyltransferase
MLAEHLDQTHDRASRRSVRIERHLAWIHHDLLAERPARVLDLCCGPGFYANRLAALGHQCTGIDYSPASIAYAVEQAKARDLACSFIQDDIRRADFGDGYDLVMCIYGEFNVFRQADARTILHKAWSALRDGGQLLLEPHTYAYVRGLGESPPTWYTSAKSVFHDTAHLRLMDYDWHAVTRAATIRYFVIDLANCQMQAYAQSMQAYTNEEYHELLKLTGFDRIRIFPDMGEADREQEAALFVITARKGAR